MQLIDYHIHSKCSMDGHYTMTEMALASYEKGVREICFTDHCDLDDYKTGALQESERPAQWQRVLEMFRELKANKPADLTVRLGRELGEGNHDLPKAREIASAPELDFVLGSLHNLEDEADFYDKSYTSLEDCRILIERYAEELIELSKMDFYDAMAHIGYTVRYMRRDGIPADFDMQNFGDMVDVCLKNLIQGGRGIEINCSGLRTKKIMAPIPTVDILKRYRELGGEIITIGSDAHRTNQAAGGLQEGLDILGELGYKYITVYEKRKPSFIKI